MSGNVAQLQFNSLPAARPRILYVASTRHNGGLEVASVRLAEILMRAQPHRQEILYACRAGMPVEQRCLEAGIPTIPFSIRNSGDLSGIAKLAKIALDHDIDIIHVHSRRDYVTAVLAKAKLKKLSQNYAPKLILHSHLQRPLGAPRWLSGYFFAPHVDRVLAVSQTVRRYVLHMHWQLKQEQVVVVPNSVDFDRFVFSQTSRDRIRKELGYKDTEFVIGMLGRLDAKGQDVAMRVLSKMADRNVKLLFVGASSKKGYDRKLQNLLARLGLKSQVTMVGMQEDIPAYLSAMDLLLHLPRDEAFGLALVEAMSCGLPVVSSNIGGCVEIVEDGVTGALVKPKDRSQIQLKLTALIGSADERKRLADAGKEFARATYTIEKQVALLSEVYDSQYIAKTLTQAEQPAGDLCDALQETH